MLKSKHSGFTLPEMFVVLSIFSVILVMVTFLLKQSVSIWGSTESRGDASFNLFKARHRLIEDLRRADASQPDEDTLFLDLTQVPASMGGNDAIWFLSAEDIDGNFAHDPDGGPFWQRNILYFLAIPDNHHLVSTTNCTPGGGPNGDDHCPHKVLVRAVIDNPPVTDPPPALPTPFPDDLEPETLLTQAEVADYIIAPDGFDLSVLRTKPGVEEADIVAVDLLWFKVNTVQSTELGQRTYGVEVDLRAVAHDEAMKTSDFGFVPLGDRAITQQSRFTVLPNNRRN